MNYRTFFYSLLSEANSEKRKEYLYNKYISKFLEVFQFDFYQHYGKEINNNPDNDDATYRVFRKMFEDFRLQNYLGVDDIVYPNKKDPSILEILFNLFVTVVVDEFDPTNGKYSNWYISCLLNNDNLMFNIREDGITTYKPLLRKFERVKGELVKKGILKTADINAFSSFLDFKAFCNEHPDYFGDAITEAEKKIAKRTVEKFYTSDEWVVLSPKSIEAARVYGANTRWCTAAREHNMFDYYNNRGPLYIFINRKENKKWQFHPRSGQFMDELDHPRNLDLFFADNEELQPIILKVCEGTTYIRDSTIPHINAMKEFIFSDAFVPEFHNMENVKKLLKLVNNSQLYDVTWWEPKSLEKFPILQHVWNNIKPSATKEEKISILGRLQDFFRTFAYYWNKI